MAKGKGTNLDNLRAYVLAHHGPKAYEAVLSAMSPEDQAALRAVVANVWYDFALEPRLLRAIDAVLGRGDLSLVDEIAVHVVDADVNGIQRLFMKVANPGYLLVRAGAYWSRFYDSGHWRIVRQSHDRATGILCGFDNTDEAFCRFLGGYIHRLFVLSGAENAVLEHPKCRARGAVECVFRGSWT
jgi:hypothetical protein